VIEKLHLENRERLINEGKVKLWIKSINGLRIYGKV
jgi:hypothetical protein